MKRPTRSILLALAAALFLFAGKAAHADRSKRQSAEESQKEAAARAHYQAAITHYDLAEYDAAIEEFKQAYAISNEPGLLFNLAQSYRLKQDYPKALHFYRTFLEFRADAPNRADVETQIAKMQSLIDEQARAPAPPQPPIAPPPPAIVSSSPPVTEPLPAPPSFIKTSRGRAVIALGTIAGALLVGGAVTGGLSLADRSTYDSGCNRGACSQAEYDRGRKTAIVTDVLIGVGAAAAVATLVVALVKRHERRPVTLGWAF